MTEQEQVGTDEQFMAEVREARENGYELVCVECGTGITDESDMHVVGCSKYVQYDPRINR